MKGEEAGDRALSLRISTWGQHPSLSSCRACIPVCLLSYSFLPSALSRQSPGLLFILLTSWFKLRYWKVKSLYMLGMDPSTQMPKPERHRIKEKKNNLNANFDTYAVKLFSHFHILFLFTNLWNWRPISFVIICND